MDYDKEYRQTKEVFGYAPEAIFQKWESAISRNHPVLDIGDGPLQRHALVEAVMRRNFTPS